MYSLNAPVPPRVSRLAAELAPALAGFDRVRDRHTLVCKRLDDPASVGHLQERARQAVAGAAPVELRIAGVDAFVDPPLGPGPVCYLAVESSGLHDVHHRLVDAFGAVDGLEGDEYVPHVTLARGGPPDVLDGLIGREIEPVSWIARELALFDGDRAKPVGSLSLG